ncbi:MAG: carboxypeptidase-like regulatory domain-containing protein [Owenweeksia sp.]|nr:carboxypeptidase-like regulatory domain-containing protein [Owenweeksia sp.]
MRHLQKPPQAEAGFYSVPAHMSITIPEHNAPLRCTLFIALGATGQSRSISGKISDAATGEPLPFVNIVVNNSQTGTSTDLDGRFSLTLPQGSNLHFSYIGYEKKTLKLGPEDDLPLEVTLSQKSDKLAEVSVFPVTNPAHRIIKNAVAQRSKNKPENLASFTYQTYSKFVATISTDSVDSSIDTVYHPEVKDSITRIDSGNYKLVKMMNRQHLFFMESVTERNYLKGKRDNEKVLASKTSGFKNPLFSLISTELQSFSFYSDYISIAGEDFLNPLTPGSTNALLFRAASTVTIRPPIRFSSSVTGHVLTMALSPCAGYSTSTAPAGQYKMPWPAR